MTAAVYEFVIILDKVVRELKQIKEKENKT